MGNLVINTNKISTNVIPNIKNADTYIKNAKTYVTSMYGLLPKDFSSRSTALNIKTEIEYLSSDIEKLLSFFQSKASSIDEIDLKNSNRLYGFVDTANNVNKTSKPTNNKTNVDNYSDYSDEKLKILIEDCTEDIAWYKSAGYSNKANDSLARRKRYIEELKKRGIFVADKDTMANQIAGLKEDIKRYNSEGYYEKAATSERRLQALEVIYEQLRVGNKIYYNYSDVLRDKLEKDVITTYDFEKYSNLDAGIYEAIALYPDACDDSLLTFKAQTYASQKEYEDLKAEKQGYIDMIWNAKFGCLDSTEDDLWWYYNREHPDNVPYFQLALLTFKGGHDSVIGSIEGQGVDPSSYQYKIGKYRKLIEFMTEEQINHYLELDYNDHEAAEKYLVDIGVHTQFSYWEDKLLGKYKYTNEDFARIATDFENSEIERITGCNIEKLDSKIAQAGENFALFDSITFECEQWRYMECISNKDFDKYADASIYDGTFVKNEDIDDCSLDYSKIAYYMTDDERKSYAYQLGKYGKDFADKYLIFLKDELRSRCGLERAKDTLSKYVKKDENGNIKTTVVDGKEYPVYDVDGLFEQIGLFGTGAVDGVQTFGEGLLNIFFADGEKSSFDYEKMYIIMLLNSQTDNKIFTPSFGYELGSSIGNMLPPMLTSAITTVITQNPVLGAKIGRLLMGLSAYGNGREELLQQDYDELTACFRSAIGALTEVGLETFLGSIPGISKMEGSEKWICKVLSEGTEESVQYVVDALFDTVILGEDFSLDINELVKSGVMGMFSSGIINAPRSLYVTFKGVKTKIDVSRLSKIYEYYSNGLWNFEPDSQITESMIKYAAGDYEGAAKFMKEFGYRNIMSKLGFDNENVLNASKIADVDTKQQNNNSEVPILDIDDEVINTEEKILPKSYTYKKPRDRLPMWSNEKSIERGKNTVSSYESIHSTTTTGDFIEGHVHMLESLYNHDMSSPDGIKLKEYISRFYSMQLYSTVENKIFDFIKVIHSEQSKVKINSYSLKNDGTMEVNFSVDGQVSTKVLAIPVVDAIIENSYKDANFVVEKIITQNEVRLSQKGKNKLFKYRALVENVSSEEVVNEMTEKDIQEYEDTWKNKVAIDETGKKYNFVFFTTQENIDQYAENGHIIGYNNNGGTKTQWVMSLYSLNERLHTMKFNGNVLTVDLIKDMSDSEVQHLVEQVIAVEEGSYDNKKLCFITGDRNITIENMTSNSKPGANDYYTVYGQTAEGVTEADAGAVDINDSEITIKSSMDEIRNVFTTLLSEGGN